MNKLAAAVIATAACLIGAPVAHADRSSCSKPLERHYSAHWHAVKHDLGKRAPGRNIRRQGMRVRTASGHKVRDARCSELRRSLAQLRALRRPVSGLLEREAVRPGQRPAGTLQPSVSAGGILDRIARCESGGDPGAVSANGIYRGKYQFNRGTWASVGGSGDPAAAPEWEQDMRAARLYEQRGAQPWPVCGYR